MFPMVYHMPTGLTFVSSKIAIFNFELFTDLRYSQNLSEKVFDLTWSDSYELLALIWYSNQEVTVGSTCNCDGACKYV
jgi:hypothetical protein